jgi:hypothetical protein
MLRSRLFQIAAAVVLAAVLITLVLFANAGANVRREARETFCTRQYAAYSAEWTACVNAP